MSGRWVLIILAALVVGLYARVRTSPGEHPAAALPQPTARLAQGPAPAASMPAALVRVPLGPVLRDPFAPPPPPPPPPQPKLVLPKLPEVPPPPPAPPALGLAFAGRWVGPDGTPAVVATSGNDVVTLRVGMVLPTGYRVESIDERSVHFLYPPMNATARLDLPPAPRFAIQ